jgi:hypothetical protein
MPDTWEATVRTAAATILRHPDKISDGLEAELYALLEKLGPLETGGLRSPASLMMPHDCRQGQHHRRSPSPAAGLGGEEVSTRIEGAEPPLICSRPGPPGPGRPSSH